MAMKEWYYAKNGQQIGPVGLEEIRGLVSSGGLDPAKDLVWTPSMADWLPAGQVPELAGGAAVSQVSPAAYTQPFAFPLAGGPTMEIVPGSEPLIATACVKRAWDLTVKHIGPLLLITLILVAISIALNVSLAALDSTMGWTPVNDFFKKEYTGQSGTPLNYRLGSNQQLSIPSTAISSVINVFLMLGATRVGLKIVSGKPFSVGMIFSGGKWFLNGLAGHILYYLIVIAGLVLLIVPGIYFALRLSAYQSAIVDRNLGPVEALKYSWSLGTSNVLALFVMALFTFGIYIAGCLALIVGLLFAYPMVFLMWTVGYRWMQYGGRAVLDDPMTGQAMLADLPD